MYRHQLYITRPNSEPRVRLRAHELGSETRRRGGEEGDAGGEGDSHFLSFLSISISLHLSSKNACAKFFGGTPGIVLGSHYYSPR